MESIKLLNYQDFFPSTVYLFDKATSIKQGDKSINLFFKWIYHLETLSRSDLFRQWYQSFVLF